MCIRLSKATKLCQMPMLINLILIEKMRTEVKMVWQYLFSTSLLSLFTVSQLLAICRFYCLKKHISMLSMISSMFSSAYWICHFCGCRISYHYYHTHCELISMLPNVFLIPVRVTEWHFTCGFVLRYMLYHFPLANNQWKSFRVNGVTHIIILTNSYTISKLFF